jgi:hypothetical protein
VRETAICTWRYDTGIAISGCSASSEMWASGLRNTRTTRFRLETDVAAYRKPKVVLRCIAFGVVGFETFLFSLLRGFGSYTGVLAGH